MLPSHLPDDPQFVYADTETCGLYPDDGAKVSVVSLSFRDKEGLQRSFAWPFALSEDTEHNLPRAEWDYLMDWLGARWLTFHNTLFDLIMFDTGCGIKEELWYPGRDFSKNTIGDTMLVQRLLDPEHPAGLEDCAPRLLKLNDKSVFLAKLKEHLKAKGARVFEYHKADWEVLKPYAIADAKVTLLIGEMQDRRVWQGEGSHKLIQDDLDRCLTLFRMEKRGLPFRASDAKKCAPILQKIVVDIDEGLPFRPTGPQAIKYFHTDDINDRGVQGLGLPPKKWTIDKKTKEPKNPSLDAEAINQLALEGVQFAREWQTRKLVADMNSKYYVSWPKLAGDDGRLRARMKQTGARSGRMSSSRVNLQAIPHDRRFYGPGGEIFQSGDIPLPRKLIEAPPGYQLWEPDLSQAELRIGAMLVQSKAMLKAFEQGLDLHSETTRLVFGLEFDDPTFDEFRPVGKEKNLSLIYGVSAKTLRKVIFKKTGRVFTEAAMSDLVEAWHDVYPEFRGALYGHNFVAQKLGFTTICTGRYRYYEPREARHKAWNQRVQGLLAQMSQDWMVAVDTYLESLNFDSPTAGLLMQIHDSLLFELPIEGGKEIAQKCCDLGIEIWDRWFPNVPGKIDLKEWGKK